ncbi:MAG: Gfo/Idh/MocA family oxidoreductase [Fuerstia sp.]|nr:Gfo/Idh/MocA family oxidoreductase [Fuerstiella sp.]
MTPPVRIGIMGTARIARTVVPQMALSERAEVVAVASRSLDKARIFAGEFGIPTAYGSYESLLTDNKVDAIYIPLPPSMHCEWTIKAAAAGKHVLCEKPLAINASQARQMIDAAIRHQIVLLDAVMWYHTARAEAMREIVHSGHLGEVRQVTSAFTFPGNALAEDNLRFSASLGGGSLLDLGWYCIGMSLWMLQRLPERVFATAQWRNDIDLKMNGILWFPQDQMASFESGFNAVRRRWMEVAGTNAALVCDDFTKPWNVDKPRFWIHNAEGTSEQKIVTHPPIERCLVDAFCKLIGSGNVNHDWLTLSLQTQQVCDALLKSARSGVVESLP